MSRPLPGTGAAPQLAARSDLAVVVGVVLIVAMMIIPLPPPVLDLLLAANMGFSLLLLLLTIHVRGPLELSSFPSVLLIATLFRLALNVSSTRLILLLGEAGSIIRAFGQFVVGGNYAVGFVVFLILVVIQFIVITRGAERVAEVAARFTLDAMPGKQMSIDADLNAGLIGEAEARRRRQEIERAADFYGAMDGASKFVKGDAIAGIVITVINICGGLGVGMIQKGLPLSEALTHYTLLTVGDGLVSQIPALLVSTATGILITRTGGETGMGAQVSGQLLAEPQLLFVAAGALTLFALVPGLPPVPFLALAALVGTLGYLLRTRGGAAVGPGAVPRPAGEGRREKGGRPEGEEEGEARPESVLPLGAPDPLELELGYGLLPLVEKGESALLARITALRRQIAGQLGVVVPAVRVRDNLQLPPNAYAVRLSGSEVARGELVPGHYLAIDSGGVTGRVPGRETREPAFGLPARWVAPEQREAAELAGYTVVDGPTVLTTHLAEVIRRHAPELLGRQEVKSLLDRLHQDYPAVVDEARELLSLGEIQKVLQNLLAEGVSIRNLVAILEALADTARASKDPDTLTEAARRRLARQITLEAAGGPEGALRAVGLAPSLVQRLVSALRGSGAPLSPEEIARFTEELARASEAEARAGRRPVLLVPPELRLAVRRMIRGSLPQVPVLAYGEVPPERAVELVATVGGSLGAAEGLNG